MKLRSAILFSLLFATTLYSDDNKSFTYERPVTISGTIIEEPFPEDSPAAYRGYSAWILHLEHPISIDKESVSEIHLNLNHENYAIAKDAFGKQIFEVTGTFYRQQRTVELRPTVMIVTSLEPKKN